MCTKLQNTSPFGKQNMTSENSSLKVSFLHWKLFSLQCTAQKDVFPFSYGVEDSMTLTMCTV